ncbi:hypothetical protein [Nitratifractor sp.]
MRERLKRPGYWIVLLAIVTVYSYRSFQKNEKKEEQKTLNVLYRSFGETIFGELKNRDLLALQSHFGKEGEKKIDLEDIALFIDTLHLDRAESSQWIDLNRTRGGLTLHGTFKLDNNLSYPIDMIMIHRGKKILLESMKVGNHVLKLDRESFPLNTPIELNQSVIRPEGNVSF